MEYIAIGKDKNMSADNSKNTDVIIQTAVTLFKEKGYENVSVQEICAKSGVSRSSFYAIFSGKSDILQTMIKGVSMDFEKMLPSFIKAENDLARIWLITDMYIQIAVKYGPQLVRALAIEEFSGQHTVLLDIEKYSEWLIPLIHNCQNNGSILNQSAPEEIVKMQYDIAKGVLVDWMLTGGDFDLEERIQRFFYDLWMTPKDMTPGGEE